MLFETPPLDWLIGYRLESLIRREYDWLFCFDRQVQISVGCLWRLLADSRICCTSEDDGLLFGDAAPVDAATYFNRRIAGTAIQSVELLDGTLDLTIRFENGLTLQIIPSSARYEAWQIDHISGSILLAIGGGDLAVRGQPPGAA
ncbi:MAG: hypothetical protein SGJ20_17775 [Planctomycetota bacterium]|nr:hypothetical protein [Planctomycetota bacterium]